jgi:predicted lipoprotein with Yx(FWY)xxD motif
VLVLAAAVLTTEAVAASRGGAVVKLGQSGLGRIIVDSHGKTLYLWGRDKRGKSSCNGACASAWPPLVTHGKPRAISGARMALLGTTRRADGRTQVTYHGHPLYYFIEDKKAGQTAGAGLNAFGGRFDAVSASGTALRKPAGDSDNGRKGPHATLEHGVLVVKGSKADDKITLRLEAGQPGTLQVDVGDDGSAEFSFTRADIASIAVDGRRGDDFVRIDEGNGVFTDSIPTTLDGGEDNDTLAGGSGAETLIGGYGNDFVDGNRGADVALMGAGDDTFQWDPGDGSDVVEGQDGADTMLFNGANVAEKFDLSANGSRLRFTRDIGTITMDTAGVETVDVKALGGLDTITVNDLADTDVNRVNADLGAQGGGGDTAADRVVVNGTNGNDTIDVSGDAGGIKVSGLAATVELLTAEAANDRLEINTLNGADTVNSAALAPGVIQLFVDGALVP